jgi:hypothetical protein
MAPKLRKVEPVAIGNPKTCFWWFDTISGEMVGNQEVGLIGPQFKPNYR